MASKPEKPDELSLKEQLGTLVHPKNLLKTVATLIPGAGAPAELLNQLDGKRVEKRLHGLESTDVQLLDKVAKLESAAAPAAASLGDWSQATLEFLVRHAEFAIMHSPPEYPARNYILPVGNGCVVWEDTVLTCAEALDLVQYGVEVKHGRAVVCIGAGVYYFEPGQVDEATGLALCKITGRNEELWKDALEVLGKYPPNLGHLSPPPKAKVEWTITPGLGQDIGFIVPCDSEDNLRGPEMSHVEFGLSNIAHFRLPRDGALKSFVSTVYSGRIRQVGSAVFSREGLMLGIISGVTKYEYDVGRRIITKGLLGFPEFTGPKLKKAK